MRQGLCNGTVSVRLSLCLSQLSTAVASCGRLAAVGPADRKRRDRLLHGRQQLRAVLRCQLMFDAEHRLISRVLIFARNINYRTVDSDATVCGEVAGDPGQFVTPSVHLCVCPGVCIVRWTVTRRCAERWRLCWPAGRPTMTCCRPVQSELTSALISTSSTPCSNR